MADSKWSATRLQDEEQDRILVVDDHAENVHLLSRILQQGGYDVEMATNGLDALAAAQASLPSLILLDIMMPGMDGLEVCKQLKDKDLTQDIPIIFISALSATVEKLEAFSAGGVDYISKPFHAKEVLARVRAHLELRRLRKQLEARNAELQKRNAELQEAMEAIQTLSGLIPICAWCGRKIEDEAGHWVTVEEYIEARSEAVFTHGMCPGCLERMRGEASLLLASKKGKG